jgi:hypothetical protein
MERADRRFASAGRPVDDQTWPLAALRPMIV